LKQEIGNCCVLNISKVAKIILFYLFLVLKNTVKSTGNSVISIIIAINNVILISKPILNAPTKLEKIKSINPAQRTKVVMIVALAVVK
jgi:hypothetical protein